MDRIMYVSGNYGIDSADELETPDPFARLSEEPEEPADLPTLPSNDSIPQVYEKPDSESEVLPVDDAMDRIISTLQSGNQIRLTVTGKTMLPFLRDQEDSVVLKPVKRRIRVGDLIFYLKTPGSPVLQRVVQVPAPRKYVVCADAQTTLERVSREQVIGLVSDIKKHNEYISTTAFFWQCISRIWIWLRPVRPELLRIILKIRKFANK